MNSGTQRYYLALVLSASSNCPTQLSSLTAGKSLKTTVPVGPFDPDGPDGPDDPDGPDTPNGPVGPDGPEGPEGPDGPDGPLLNKNPLMQPFAP